MARIRGSISTTWPWATRSDRLAAGLLSGLLALLPSPARASGFPAPEQALREAFPGATFERRTWALSDEEAARVESLGGSAPQSKLIAGWIVTGAAGAPAGLALLDAHEVRSKRETLLVSMSPALAVTRVDVLAFAEPGEYLASKRWLEQFAGRSLGPELELKREIRGITGATLTSRAATAATRRCLAIARVLRDRGAVQASAPAPTPASTPASTP